MLQHIIGIVQIHLKYFKYNWWFLLYTLLSTLPPIIALEVLREANNMDALVVASLLPLVLAAGAFPLMVLVWDMISDMKESKTFLILRRLGMNESALWIATISILLPVIAISGIGGIYFLKLFYEKETFFGRIDFNVMIYLQLTLCGAMVGIGTLFSSTISNKTVVGFLYLIYFGYSVLVTFNHMQPLNRPGYIVDATYTMLYKVIYAAFFPSVLFGRSWGHILTYIIPNPANGFRPQNFTINDWKSNPFVALEKLARPGPSDEVIFLNIMKAEPTIWDSLMVMWLVIPAHFLVTWYLNQTNFGGSEYPLPYTFLFRPSYWTNQITSDQDTISIVDVEKKFSGADVKSLDGVSLEFTKGNTYVVLGQNGAGKSTLIGCLTGMTRITKGSGAILGYDISQNNARARSKMGICSQEELFIPNMTAFELVQLYCRFKGVDVSAHGSMKKYVIHMLKKVNLDPHINQNVTEFSGGMQRRMSLILACIGENKVFFFDEPTAGLDPLSRDQVWKLVEEVKKENIVFLTTHDMDEADHLSDKGTLD